MPVSRPVSRNRSRPRRKEAAATALFAAAARRSRFGAALQLPTVRLAASSIENLEPGMVLRLDLAANAMPEWRVGGLALASAQAIRQGAHRAARIERPIPEAEP